MEQPGPDEPRTFGELLHRIRLERGLSLNKMGELLDYNPSTLGQVERGTRNVGQERMLAFCERLDIDPHRAIVLAFLDRLPEDARSSLLKGDNGTNDALGIAHEQQKGRIDFQMQLAQYLIDIDSSGALKLSRRFEGFRPTPSGRRRGYRMTNVRDTDSPKSKLLGFWIDRAHSHQFDVHECSDLRSIRIEPQSEQQWPAEGIGCVIESVTPNAYDEDGSSGDYSVFLQFVSSELAINVAFPLGDTVGSWEATAVAQGRSLSDPTNNLLDRGVCRKWSLLREPGRACLRIKMPLAGHVYGVRWTEHKEAQL